MGGFDNSEWYKCRFVDAEKGDGCSGSGEDKGEDWVKSPILQFSFVLTKMKSDRPPYALQFAGPLEAALSRFPVFLSTNKGLALPIGIRHQM